MTVSRVVNGGAGVRATTRDRVIAAIAALGYIPDAAAQRLTGAGAVRIGVVVGGTRAGYLGELLIGLIDAANSRGVELVVQACGRAEDAEAGVNSLVRKGVEGVVLAPPFCESVELISMLAHAALPVVAVSSGVADERVSAVGIDERRAAYDMTRLLLALGHERIGFIGGDPRLSVSAHRLSGFRAAMEETGLGSDLNGPVVHGLCSYRSGLDGAEALLALPRPPTAIFACNDEMAAASVAWANRLGLDVPGDLTVVGFDDTPLATRVWPELTTVRQPIREMAGAAVDLLLSRIQGLQEGRTIAVEMRLMAHKVIRRQSDAAPRRAPHVRWSSRPADAHRETAICDVEIDGA